MHSSLLSYRLYNTEHLLSWCLDSDSKYQTKIKEVLRQIIIANFLVGKDFSQIFFVDEARLTLLLVLLNKRAIGKFALTFQACLLRYINREEDLIRFLANLSERDFPEIFDNLYLSESQLHYLKDWLEREIQIIGSALNQKSLHLYTLDRWFSDCAECYSALCFDSEDRIKPIFKSYERAPEQIFTLEKIGTTYTSFCFELMQLLAALSTPQKINPQTKRRFNNKTVELLEKRLAKELAMYRRASELK